MKVYLASDHAGFELKGVLAGFIRSLGHTVEDLGPESLDPHDDYPALVRPVAEKVSVEPDARGVVLGGSGQGEAIVSNRISNVRAAVYYGGTIEIVQLAREHNNANILSLGARFVTHEEAVQAVEVFLATEFSGEERHVRRIAQLT